MGFYCHQWMLWQATDYLWMQTLLWQPSPWIRIPEINDCEYTQNCSHENNLDTNILSIKRDDDGWIAVIRSSHAYVIIIMNEASVLVLIRKWSMQMDGSYGCSWPLTLICHFVRRTVFMTVGGQVPFKFSRLTRKVSDGRTWPNAVITMLIEP